jgi:hypothetical protein
VKSINVSKIKNRVERSNAARKELVVILNDESHPLYLAKDIELARKFGLSRHTLYKIRDELDTPSRKNRIITMLKAMPTADYTIGELSKKISVKYQNLYKILLEEKIKFREEDTSK